MKRVPVTATQYLHKGCVIAIFAILQKVVCTPADVDNDGLASCTEVEFENKMSPGAPANQIDNDGDCFVECFDGSTSWVGGASLLGSSCSTINEGQDCNDTSSLSILEPLKRVTDSLTTVIPHRSLQPVHL